MADNLENIKAILFDNSGTITMWQRNETRKAWPDLMPELKQKYIIAVVSAGTDITESWLEEIGLDSANSKNYIRPARDGEGKMISEFTLVLRKNSENIVEPSMYMFLQVNKAWPGLYPLIAEKIGVNVSEMLLIDDGMHGETEENNSNVKGAIDAGAHGLHYTGSVAELRNNLKENHLRF